MGGAALLVDWAVAVALGCAFVGLTFAFI